LDEKLRRIQDPNLLQKWVVDFDEYKNLKRFEQDVDAALSQQEGRQEVFQEVLRLDLPGSTPNTLLRPATGKVFRLK
jgi:hypothetical protein